jgi:drug/metabolite transporter (DMT)-like permease
VTGLVFAMVLGSAFLHASWNAMLKRHEDPEAASVGAFAVCTAAGALAAAMWPDGHWNATAVAWSAVAGVFEAGYMITLARALSRAPLGPVYTVSRGGALLVIWPISILWLGEHITLFAVAGTALIALGLAATGFGAGLARRRHAGGDGLGLASISALCIGGYHIAYKLALAAGGSPAIVFAVSLAVALPLNFARLDARGRHAVGRALRGRPVLVVAAGLVSCASFLLFLAGLAHAGAGAVFTLRNSSVLFAQALSWALGERPSRLGAIAAVCVAGGAVLLGWR